MGPPTPEQHQQRTLWAAGVHLAKVMMGVGELSPAVLAAPTVRMCFPLQLYCLLQLRSLSLQASWRFPACLP